MDHHQHLLLSLEMAEAPAGHLYNLQLGLLNQEDVAAVVDKMEIWEEHQAIKDFQEEVVEMVVDLDHGLVVVEEEWDHKELLLQVPQLDLVAMEYHQA